MDIGKTNAIQHAIETVNDAPIAFKPRRIPKGLENDVEKMINELLENDIIRESTSPWSFPLVIVRKKNGDIRMCVDYRSLNAKTSRPIFPIPSADELFDTVSDSMYFTSLDLSSGYYQVPIKEEDIQKSAFSIRYGQLEFNRIPFDLCSASATFQKLMNVVLIKVNWIKCVIYLDDILVFDR